jgi:hypothetical protein
VRGPPKHLDNHGRSGKSQGATGGGRTMEGVHSQDRKESNAHAVPVELGHHELERSGWTERPAGGLD